MEDLVPDRSGLYVVVFKNKMSLSDMEITKIFSKYGNVVSLRHDANNFYSFIRYNEYSEASYCLQDAKTLGHAVAVAKNRSTEPKVDDSAKTTHSGYAKGKQEHLNNEISPVDKLSGDNTSRPLKSSWKYQATPNDIAGTNGSNSTETLIYKVIVANLPYSLLRRDFMKLIQVYNPLSVSKMECSGIMYNIIYSQISFISKSDADKIIMELDGRTIQGKGLIVRSEEEFLACLDT